MITMKSIDEKAKISKEIKSLDNQIEMCNRINSKFGNAGFVPFRTTELVERRQHLSKLLKV